VEFYETNKKKKNRETIQYESSRAAAGTAPFAKLLVGGKDIGLATA
jgi:hypothetical protein